MRILYSRPIDDGYYMPAEFSEHEGCVLVFPERPDSFPGGAYEAQRVFAAAASAIAESEKVTVLASFELYETARRILPPQIRVVEMSNDDVWVRDSGPTFLVKDGARERRGVNWGFNAWGGLVDGLYFPWDKDNKMARKLCDLYDADMYDKSSLILEGGSVAVDGEGTLITTEECLLSAGRNPGLTKSEIEERLKENLGVHKVIWLKYGLSGDDTNGHVDNICAFTAPATVVLSWTDDPDDPQYERSRTDLEILERETDARGRRFTVHKLPTPVVRAEAETVRQFSCCCETPPWEVGQRMPASYINFYISNNAVIMPGYDQPSDEDARRVLQALFPTRKVVVISGSYMLLTGGGCIHCMTQQVPALR